MHDWKTLMEWIRGVRNESDVADKKRPADGYADEKDGPERRARRKLHRQRCLAWLLNSMARNLRFDKKKARLLNK